MNEYRKLVIETDDCREVRYHVRLPDTDDLVRVLCERHLKGVKFPEYELITHEDPFMTLEGDLCDASDYETAAMGWLAQGWLGALLEEKYPYQAGLFKQKYAAASPNGDWVTQMRRAAQRNLTEWFAAEFPDHVVLLDRTAGPITGHAVTGIIDDGLDGGAQ